MVVVARDRRRRSGKFKRQRGARAVIVGHSERRSYHKETDGYVIARVYQ